METCATCGNVYDKPLIVTQGDKSAAFDSFECAIQGMAPQCTHCDCRIIGHGVESDGRMYCCAHCADQSGVSGVEDRV
ncbi:DNA-directed RNA polymerase subunit RPC12/RpoP [Hoyosella altamirensis]|uniref:DNA-directed RNA polymerase subunit RPC12/RpoP n=1 Tax=Hoyosella altamirensis TaxID=616997 RepID=A0A839RSC8_9ACTN|nr:hypothetical protein [Hoyosella altamirensis]MBB3038771.1 DNA-directed RNA polymerase subunit RPC12/RpoP [Hoyosella altamirensis]